MFNKSKSNFILYRDKINKEDIPLISSSKDIEGLKGYLINDIEMNEKRVETAIKKFYNNYK